MTIKKKTVVLRKSTVIAKDNASYVHDIVMGSMDTYCVLAGKDDDLFFVGKEIINIRTRDVYSSLVEMYDKTGVERTTVESIMSKCNYPYNGDVPYSADFSYYEYTAEDLRVVRDVMLNLVFFCSVVECLVFDDIVSLAQAVDEKLQEAISTMTPNDALQESNFVRGIVNSVRPYVGVNNKYGDWFVSDKSVQCFPDYSVNTQGYVSYQDFKKQYSHDVVYTIVDEVVSCIEHMVKTKCSPQDAVKKSDDYIIVEDEYYHNMYRQNTGLDLYDSYVKFSDLFGLGDYNHLVPSF